MWLNPSQCHCVFHISHMNYSCSGFLIRIWAKDHISWIMCLSIPLFFYRKFLHVTPTFCHTIPNSPIKSTCYSSLDDIITYSYLLPILTYLLTHSLTPCSRVLLEKLTRSQLVKKFPTCYGTRKFIIAFTSARHLSLSWPRSIQSMPPHSTFWRSILMLSSHLRLDLPSDSFPQDSPPKPCMHLSPPSIRATCPAYLIFLDLITRKIFGEECRSLSSSLCCFLHYRITSSLLSPNIILSIRFSKTLNLHFSLNFIRNSCDY